MNKKRAQEALMDFFGLTEENKVALRKELKAQRKTRIKQKKPLLKATA